MDDRAIEVRKTKLSIEPNLMIPGNRYRFKYLGVQFIATRDFGGSVDLYQEIEEWERDHPPDFGDDPKDF